VAYPPGCVRSRLLLLAFLAALPGAARAAPAEWELSAELGAGLDGNALRTTAPDPAERAPFASAAVRARGAARSGALSGSAALSGAARLHPSTSRADAVASGLETDGVAALGGGLSAGLALSGADLSDRAGLLARHALRGAASLSLGDAGLGLSLSAGWSLFEPRAAGLRDLTARGPLAGVRGRWSPGPGHALALSGSAWWQDYPRWEPAPRRDTTWSAALEYAYRGPFLAGLAWESAWNRSGAEGGDFDRHRLTARAAAWLPGELRAALRLALQRSDYPAPLRLRDQLLAAQGGEGQDLVELRLARRLDERWELAVTAAHYRGEASGEASAPAFRRTVVSLSLGWRLRSEEGD